MYNIGVHVCVFVWVSVYLCLCMSLSNKDNSWYQVKYGWEGVYLYPEFGFEHIKSNLKETMLITARAKKKEKAQ